jgi:thioredoxin-related protein
LLNLKNELAAGLSRYFCFNYFYPMRLLTLLAAVFFSVTLQAQADTTAPFRRNPIIPPFELLQTDSSVLTKDKIEKKRNTLIMFFSPSCEHCQHQTKDMIAGMDSLKDVQIIMATYQPFEEMTTFYKDYQIDRFHNIKMGRDTKWFLPAFFRMKSLPYLALYDKKGNLITTFEGNHSVAKLVDAFNERKE